MVQNHMIRSKNIKKNDDRVSHKFSQAEYEVKRAKLNKNLEQIKNNLEKCLNSPLKAKMLAINIQNISNAVDYYYNVNTSRELANVNKKYKESAKLIVKITRFMHAGDYTENIQKQVYYHLNEIIRDLQDQRTYIATIEDEYHNKRRMPNY
ncbi:hypothetical protein [Candidatus Harpocratesius sp.]